MSVLGDGERGVLGPALLLRVPAEPARHLAGTLQVLALLGAAPHHPASLGGGLKEINQSRHLGISLHISMYI